MRKLFRKRTYWAIIISAYVLLLVAVSVPLFGLDLGLFTSGHKNPSVLSAELGQSHRLTDVLAQATGYSKALLPLGPNEGHLPGDHEIWSELFKSEEDISFRATADGFDGVQVVARLEDFFKDAVAELFLSGEPRQGFLRGNALLLLNNSGLVQVVDCTKPDQPVLSGTLPYDRVIQMQMQGNIAYLLIGDGGNIGHRLVISDLSDPLRPRLVSRLDLDEPATAFFFSGRRLITCASSKGYKRSLSVHLYDLTADFQLVPLGRGIPPLINRFVQFDHYLLSAGLRSGLDVVDFSEPLEPEVIARVDIADRVKKMVRSGHKVYASSERKLYVVDLQDPERPAVLDMVEEANHSARFLVLAEHVFFMTPNGYLSVFKRPAENSIIAHQGQTEGLPGELVPNRSGGGFTLLSDVQGSLPASVTDVMNPPHDSEIIDTLFWQGFLIVLNDDGLVQFFRRGEGGVLQRQVDLKLSSTQRWLAASAQRLYIGGGSVVDVVAKKSDGGFGVTGQIESPGQESWDGLVIEKTLCVAAGEKGVVCFSGEDPDHLGKGTAWALPKHLQAQDDVRLLASSGDRSIIAAAGPVGVVTGKVSVDGQFQLEGLIDFTEPISTLAMVENFCLVSTGIGVEVIDIHQNGFLQNLGDIDFPGVTRLVAAESGVWAGYVPGDGWSILAVPYLVPPGENQRLRSALTAATGTQTGSGRYRLKLFNDLDVVSYPEIVSFSSSLSDGKASGGSRALQ